MIRQTTFCFSLFVAAWMLLEPHDVAAQSYARPAQPNFGQPQPGSATQGSASQGSATHGSDARGMPRAPLAMRGFCPVSLLDKKEWEAGDPRFTAVYDGRAYRFSGQAQMQRFRADPVRYVPALDGDNIAHFVHTGHRVEGNLAKGIVHAGRIYFVGSAEERQAFIANPTAYAQADLALGGQCVVCRVNMNQQMPGSPSMTLIHNGIRYQFAGLEQQKMFLATPARYTVAANVVAGANPAGSDTRPQGSETRGSASHGSANRGSGSR